MFTARKASVEDCGLIREMACVAFPDTYKTILSPEQLDYMMEWMYSPENLRRQMAEGHVYYIAYKDGTPCGYLSVQPEADDLYILQKSTSCPDSRVCTRGASSSARLSNTSNSSTRLPAGWSST